MIKSSRNQMGNAQNPYQRNHKRILCVCSAGLLRSPTAARVIAEGWNHNTRAVGISPEYALIPVSEALIQWADEIVCMQLDQQMYLETCVDSVYGEDKGIPITCLRIEDDHAYMDDYLVRMIKEKYGEEGRYGNA